MYIKDLSTGKIHKYGSNKHDSLVISIDGRYLAYRNLQCGEGSALASKNNNEGYLFCDADGNVVEGFTSDEYFDIGGKFNG